MKRASEVVPGSTEGEAGGRINARTEEREGEREMRVGIRASLGQA